ncbi:MAG TPA: tripartite tricarboxylate transporter substrate-binding protein, partial [Roseomonas sp.]
MFTRRLILASGLGLATARAGAQEGRPIRIIVPAPPGGPTDILARAVAERAQAALGQPVIVDNRAGAGGVIGTEVAARAAPDGLTFVLGHNQTHASNQAMMARLPYHVIDSFAPVAKLATVHHA